MSTLIYAQLTGKREEAIPNTSTSTSPPGVQSYMDVLAALVPAEVLTVHTVVLSFTTMTEKNQAGELVTTITQPGTLKWVFVALLLLSISLYFVGHRSSWDRWDFMRMLIPPLAFVGWTMLQKATAFDAIAPDLGQASRDAIAVIGAVILAVIAAQLAYQADQKKPIPVQLPEAVHGD
ncbi:hypothetical protein KSF_007540 [Reticulibacter mediterranei]|uniref:Uncharacterized protein n=1 Tax=Reticulibacter mediterranei TaxID=2778369 RepID=A0A8J3II74_9CHLR|nr:hypothetical protein [Reticulibacter mediterranei]GHO90706.1 hypothetical protein KSF_007540 [Reticulibacter mediterranei]